MKTYVLMGFAYFLTGCIIAVLRFFDIYCDQSHLQSGVKMRSFVIESVKLGGACFLLLVVFTISHMVCKHYNIGFVLSLIVSILIASAFFGLCILFKIGQISSSENSEE